MNSVVKGGGQNNGGGSCSNQQKQMGGGAGAGASAGAGAGAGAGAVQSQRSKALADAAVRGLVQGGAQQVARMAVQGLIGDTGNPNGDVDGINILELVGDLFLNWTI
ncbi:hypothetical protein ACH5RR_025229 [Cinchona calisaya]|uniref:Uncharacterized protein n=1 Tax=Cinchona calisaya TaxID=153742 RepID=A0ABD2Z275_9GENT